MTVPRAEETHGEGWRALRRLLLLGLLAATLAWLILDQPQRGWSPPQRVAVTLEGEHYRLDAGELDWLQAFSTLHFTRGEKEARALVAAEIEARLDRIFDEAHERLPGFADWYYSLEGEYTRLAMTLLARLNLADAERLTGRAAERLFPEEIWQRELVSLELATAQRLNAHHAGLRAGWLAGLTERLSGRRVPAPLEGHPDTAAMAKLELDLLSEALLEREREALQRRVSLSTIAAGGAAAGPALWRTASRAAAAGSGRAAAARSAGRAVSRAGSAAVGGATFCAPGAVLAAGCALIAGSATWLAADYLLLRVDEAVNREELLEGLGERLEELRVDMERDMLDAYDAVIRRHYRLVRGEIENSFVPARAIIRARDDEPSAGAATGGPRAG